MGIKGINSISNTCTSDSSSNIIPNERKMNEQFHLRVTSKHTKIDILIDSGSQANLISEGIFKKIGLETKLRPKPYPLGWISGNAKLQVTK